MPPGDDTIRDLVMDEDLLEALAAVEHDRWSHWQRYLHSKCERTENGSLVIPPALVDQWTAQIDTPYEALTEDEKASDREQVLRYLPVVADFLGRRLAD